MSKMIYLDMDGTIADLYGVENWLEMIVNGDPKPYKIAKRIVNENVLLKLEKAGYTLGIVSWLAKGSTKEYDKAVRKAKREWLEANFSKVNFAEVHIVKYGTPKFQVVKDRTAILVDDEERNLQEWKGTAIHASELINIA